MSCPPPSTEGGTRRFFLKNLTKRFLSKGHLQKIDHRPHSELKIWRCPSTFINSGVTNDLNAFYSNRKLFHSYTHYFLRETEIRIYIFVTCLSLSPVFALFLVPNTRKSTALFNVLSLPIRRTCPSPFTPFWYLNFFILYKRGRKR